MARRSGLALVVLALTAAPLAAQNPLELGIDAGIAVRLNDPSGFAFTFPTGHFRVGIPAGQKLSIEPKVSISYVKFSGADAFMDIGTELGVLFHFKPAGEGSRPYLRPFAGLEYSDLGGVLGSDTDFHAGAGIGVKLPMKATRMAWRLEGGLVKGLEDGGETGFFALIGLSFFTR